MLIQFLVMFVQVAFTGSTEIGQKIMEAAAQTNLKVHLPAMLQPGLCMFGVKPLETQKWVWLRHLKALEEPLDFAAQFFGDCASAPTAF